MARVSSKSAVEDIQRQMALIRLELHADVRGAVKAARSIVDWRSLVGSHPFLSLGVAAAAGYLMVPRLPREPPAGVYVSAPPPGAAAGDMPPDQTLKRQRSHWALLGTTFGLLAPVVVRAVQNYALRQIENWLANLGEEDELDPPTNGNGAKPPKLFDPSELVRGSDGRPPT
jgi:hypothetical protein